MRLLEARSPRSLRRWRAFSAGRATALAAVVAAALSAPATALSPVSAQASGVAGPPTARFQHFLKLGTPPAAARPHALTGRVDPATLVTPSPFGYTPCDVRNAYYLNGAAQDGSGITIAIIDAFDAPTIASDLHTFDTTLTPNLPDPPSFVVHAMGPFASTAASNLDGWREETSLDVEWAHALAPRASLVLVQGVDDGHLLDAVDWAISPQGGNADIVSMSWGSSEASWQVSADSHFPTGAGKLFVASSGDNGVAAGAQWPAASQAVMGVGGTSLAAAATGSQPSTYHTGCPAVAGVGASSASETAWTSGGGGVSTVQAFPAYQSGRSNSFSTAHRSTPDVAADADPQTGVATFDSTPLLSGSNAGKGPGWIEAGGTSLAAPLWAGMMALKDQQLVAAGQAKLQIANSFQASPPYSLPAADLTDIVGAPNSNGPGSPGVGYDVATGLGSPRMKDILNPNHMVLGAPANATAGSSFTVTISVRDGNGNLATGYSGTVVPASSDSRASFTPSSVSVAGGTGSFTATLLTAGGQTVSASDTSGLGSSASVAIAAASPVRLWVGAPSSVNRSCGFSTTAAAQDSYGNTATSFNGTVTLRSSDPQASIQAAHAASAGIANFATSLATAGGQTLTASASGLSNGSASVAVSNLACGLAPTRGYDILTSFGGIYSFGDSQYYGNLIDHGYPGPAIGLATTPSGRGYDILTTWGGIYTFGDAQYFGNLVDHSYPGTAVALANTPSGHGYAILGPTGSLYTFGDASYFGNLIDHGYPGRAVSLAYTPSGNGYSILTDSGAIYTFGDAPYFGNLLDHGYPGTAVSLAATGTGGGYSILTTSGAIYSFGDAQYFGNLIDHGYPPPAVALANTP